MQFTLLPCQDRNRNGWIKDYGIDPSANGTKWANLWPGGLARTPTTRPSRRRIVRSRPRDVKLIAVSPFDRQPFASLAELDGQVEPGGEPG